MTTPAVIEPFETGSLEVTDGYAIAWERCGTRGGRACIYLHGGPGGKTTPGARNFFDASDDAILFDQRGCGRSTPHASDPRVDLSTQTTAKLVDDIERLRAHAGFERVTLLGLSWGTTLALAYAHAHPDRVAGLVLGLVATTSRDYVKWITEDVARIFPREHARFVAAVPASLRHLPLVDAYATLLADADPDVRERAAIAWCDWEDAHVSLTPGHRPSPLFRDPVYRMAFARLVTHYWRHAAFLDDALLRDAARLDGIPGILVHGRYDVSGPLGEAFDLANRWKTSELRVMEDGGHGGPSFPDEVRRAMRDVGLMGR